MDDNAYDMEDRKAFSDSLRRFANLFLQLSKDVLEMPPEAYRPLKDTLEKSMRTGLTDLDEEFF